MSPKDINDFSREVDGPTRTGRFRFSQDKHAVGPHEGATNRQHSGIKVDVAPTEAEHFAAPEPGYQHHSPGGFEPIRSSGCEQSARLIGGKRSTGTPIHSGSRGKRRDIATNQAIALGLT
jgi:hypothetical protein